MHFSIPLKSSRQSPVWTVRTTSPPKSAFGNLIKRRRRTLYILLFLAFAGLYYLYSSNDTVHSAAMAAAPNTVIVLALDKSTLSASYSKKILDNRKKYAGKWGYAIFTKDIADYAPGNEYKFKDDKGKVRTSPKSFQKLPMIRHAMATYPYTTNFWFLSSNSLIMNMDLNLEEHILQKTRLNSLMLRDKPVIPPESIIKTFKRTDADDIQFIITQDSKSVCSDSFIVRKKADEMPGTIKAGKTIFGHYLMDVWFDPLYRFYHWTKADTSALEHMIQWHPTILAKMAMIPQRIMLSYPLPTGGNSHANDKAKKDSEDLKLRYAGSGYEKGDFVVHFEGCENPEKDCAKEFDRYWKMTQKSGKKKQN